MGCGEVERRLVDYLLGELSWTERHGVADHLRHCPACARRLDRLSGVLRLVRESFAQGA